MYVIHIKSGVNGSRLESTGCMGTVDGAGWCQGNVCVGGGGGEGGKVDGVSVWVHGCVS
jgi:hypothetical protein